MKAKSFAFFPSSTENKGSLSLLLSWWSFPYDFFLLSGNCSERGNPSGKLPHWGWQEAVQPLHPLPQARLVFGLQMHILGASPLCSLIPMVGSRVFFPFTGDLHACYPIWTSPYLGLRILTTDGLCEDLSSFQCFSPRNAGQCSVARRVWRLDWI